MPIIEKSFGDRTPRTQYNATAGSEDRVRS
ncbi:MAG: hypothetical protein QOH33_2401, partial [Paraburkholderia sp.]|nr:hypothetical protein [Paraburkholderia sp.]